MDVADVDVRGQDVVASLQAAAGFVEFPTEVEDMCGGGNDDLPKEDLHNSADFDWELFLEGLGDDFPPTATDDVPAPIRTLFVAHAKKADSAMADFQHELRRGESRQDNLTVELRVHRLQTFKAVRQDTDALKAKLQTMKQQLDLMTAAARKSEEKVAMLIATLKEMQEDNVRFGQDLTAIGRKLATPPAVATTQTAVPPPSQEGLPKSDADDAGQKAASVGQDGFGPPNAHTRFAPETGSRDHQRHPLFPNVDPSNLTQVPADEDTQPAPKDTTTEGMCSPPIATSG